MAWVRKWNAQGLPYMVQDDGSGITQGPAPNPKPSLLQRQVQQRQADAAAKAAAAEASIQPGNGIVLPPGTGDQGTGGQQQHNDFDLAAWFDKDFIPGTGVKNKHVAGFGVFLVLVKKLGGR